MATKGPSNRYGNTRGAKHKGEATKHIAYQWAKDFSRNTIYTHFIRHGKEFNCSSLEEYVAKVIHFANAIDRIKYDSVVDIDKTTYKWNKYTGETIMVTNDGYVISYSHMAKKGFIVFQRREKKNG